MQAKRLVTNDFGNGSGFIVHLIFCSFIVVSLFVGLLWLGLVLSFGSVPNEVRNSAISYLEAHLNAQTNGTSEPLEVRYLDLFPEVDTNIISVIVKPDYWKTALRPCRVYRSSCLNRAYRARIVYELSGKVKRKNMSMKWSGSSYYWHIEN